MGRAVGISELDSRRFGVPIARLEVDHPSDVVDLLARCRAVGVAMVVMRSPADRLEVAQAIETAGGVLCDTLFYYEREVGLAPVPHGVRVAGPADEALVRSIAAVAFAGYDGHYHADPRLDRQAADETYIDWAGRSVTTPDVADIAWIVDDAGFLTLRSNDPDETEIVLNAVHPDRQRQGLYSRLLQMALAHSAGLEAKRCIVSTQLSNVPVQRVWVHHGFMPTTAQYTFHVWLG